MTKEQKILETMREKLVSNFLRECKASRQEAARCGALLLLEMPKMRARIILRRLPEGQAEAIRRALKKFRKQS